jgi:hypothetical protein
MNFTYGEKRAAAEREVKQRERVYPRLIENRRMTKATAERETAIMRAIADDYRELEQKNERLI